MSIQAIAWVLEHSRSEGMDRLVLLAIANHADAGGLNAWPSADRIAQEARVHRATVFRCLARLSDMGELRVIAAGRGRGKTNSYQLNLLSQAATLNQRFTVAASAKKGRSQFDKRSHSCDTEPSLTVQNRAAASPTPSAAALRPPPVEDPRALTDEERLVGKEAVAALKSGLSSDRGAQAVAQQPEQEAVNQ